jgi:hypothetical protein
MNDKQKQFVRMVDEALPLLRQVRSAASLAPRPDLGEAVAGMVRDLERLRDDRSLWFYGQDASGRFQDESGQLVEVADE